MKITAINRSLKYSTTFTGLLANKQEKVLSTPTWDYGYENNVGDDHTVTTIDYYPFSDESDESARAYVKEHSSHFVDEEDIYITYTRDYDINLCRKLPVTRREYLDYINRSLTESEYKNVELKLKNGGFGKFARPQPEYDEIV